MANETEKTPDPAADSELAAINMPFPGAGALAVPLTEQEPDAATPPAADKK